MVPSGFSGSSQLGGPALFGRDKLSNCHVLCCGLVVGWFHLIISDQMIVNKYVQPPSVHAPALSVCPNYNAAVSCLPPPSVMPAGLPLGPQPGLPLNFTTLFMQLEAHVLKTTHSTEHLWLLGVGKGGGCAWPEEEAAGGGDRTLSLCFLLLESFPWLTPPSLF